MKPTSEDACKLPPRLTDDDLYRKITRCLESSKQPITNLNKLLKIDTGTLRPSTADKSTWAKALVNVLCDDRHFDLDLTPDFKLDPKDEHEARLVEVARKCVFPYQKSAIECKIVERGSLPKDEIHVQQSSHQENSTLEAMMTTETRGDLDRITVAFTNPEEQVAPVFVPSIRPGPDPEITGNFFLQEDPWSSTGESGVEEGDDDEDISQEERAQVGEEMPKAKEENAIDIFLVVEPEHLERVRSTLRRRPQAGSKTNLRVVVLPKQRRGIGVVRAIIKTLAECFHFPLYWTIEDDLKCMFQFDENDRRWRKCSFVRGLLFGQRVFQDCLKSSVKELPVNERLSFAVEAVNKWPSWANETKKIALHLLMDGQQFSQVQCNPGLLETPFTNERMKVDCIDDAHKWKELEAAKKIFLDECHRRLFGDNINRIGSVSIAHEATRKSDFVTNYPSAHYRCKEGQYVVLYNTRALQLQKINFVTDDVILSDEKFSESGDGQERYWGTRGSSESFHRALSFKGVTSYQVICIVHSHKKSLTDAFEAHSG